jgi:hypothetical protein
MTIHEYDVPPIEEGKDSLVSLLDRIIADVGPEATMRAIIVPEYDNGPKMRALAMVGSWND